MTALNELKVSVVVGRINHSQAVIDDLRQRAAGAVISPAWEVSVDVVRVDTRTDDSDKPGPGGPGDVTVAVGRPARGAARIATLAGTPGPVGAAARLLRDNLESRRVAAALARREDVVARLLGSAVVVAADPSAVRAVWQLRRRTGAHLVHGPTALVNAVKVLADG